jgi:hypothetical protein
MSYAPTVSGMTPMYVKCINYQKCLCKGRGDMYKIGDKVKYQLFNSVERAYYGPLWVAKIIAIDTSKKKCYRVQRSDGITINLYVKEIMSRVDGI